MSQGLGKCCSVCYVEHCVVICVQNVFKEDHLRHFIPKKKALGAVEQPNPGRQSEIDTIIHN